MLPVDIASMSVIARCGGLRVLADPEKVAFRVEPDVDETQFARPVVDLFFGEHDAFRALSNEVLIAVLKARGAWPERDDDILEMGKELAAQKELADDAQAALSKLDAQDKEVIAKLEADLADARSKIPVTAPATPDPTAVPQPSGDATPIAGHPAV